MSRSPYDGQRSRDRRGRGMRGPGVYPRLIGTHAMRTGRQRFDELVLRVVTELDERWADRLGLIEYAVEDAPQIPDDWKLDTVPLSSLVRGSGTKATRLVVFRRPIEHRCENRSETEAMVLTVVIEQLAELLGLDPSEVDPRYSGD